MSFAEDIKRIFRVFSRRHVNDAKLGAQQVSKETRTRLLHVYRELVGWANNPFDNQTAYTYWSRLHDLLGTLKGDWVLSQRFKQHEPFERTRPHHDVAAYVYECTTGELFDFIELSFQVKELEELMKDSQDAIRSINQIFESDDVPYRLTDFVREEQEVLAYPNSMSQQRFITAEVVSYPIVIDRTDEVVYEEALAPSLEVLARSEFGGANKEFRDSLEHYRAGRYGDFLSNCGSALESVLQVICDEHRWSYGSDATLGQLLDKVISGLHIDAVYSENFKLLATIRNRLSSSHGGGSKPRDPDLPYARLMLTNTAAAIVFLVQMSDSK